jgi:hypothetical protein
MIKPALLALADCGVLIPSSALCRAGIPRLTHVYWPTPVGPAYRRPMMHHHQRDFVVVPPDSEYGGASEHDVEREHDAPTERDVR